MDYATEIAEYDFCNATADNGAASASIWIKVGKGWIYNPKDTPDVKERYRCTEAIGFLKHAFILSFFYLAKAAENGWDLYEGQLKETMYFDSVREVISLGGDTDTNACIVGGMIGAFLGCKNI